MSLEETRSDFESRIQEAREFVAFILQQESIGADAPIKTLKASCFLLLYNLVESTLTSAIESIHEEIEQNGFGFDECRDELREELHRLLCKRTWEKVKGSIVSINRDIVHRTFLKKEVFSGNLDPRLFRKHAKRYGFRPPVPKKIHDKIRELKDRRNDLAHGVFSFEEIGRDIAVQELELYLKSVESYLINAMEHIADYLDNKSYLRSPSLQAPAFGSPVNN